MQTHGGQSCIAGDSPEGAWPRAAEANCPQAILSSPDTS